MRQPRGAVTAAAAAAVALPLALAGCGLSTAAGGSPAPKPSIAVAAAWPELISDACQYQQQGMTPAQVVTAMYEAPESPGQVRAIVTYALSQCDRQ